VDKADGCLAVRMMGLWGVSVRGIWGGGRCLILGVWVGVEGGEEAVPDDQPGFSRRGAGSRVDGPGHGFQGGCGVGIGVGIRGCWA
jgi:hypothetical protein